MSDTSIEPQSPISPPSYTYPPITIILTVILLIFFFLGFFSVYFCRCFLQNLYYTFYIRRNPSTMPAITTTVGNRGLDPVIVQSFPTFKYSSVKDYRKERFGLECAICLVEFDGSDELRLLTTCCHVFHQECVDLWLETHTTCPVCRRKLDSPAQSPVKSPSNAVPPEINSSVSSARSAMKSPSSAVPEIKDNQNNDDGAVCITIRDENEAADREKVGQKGQRCHHGSGELKDYGSEGSKVEKFSRSHSTGHSIVINTEDRYTLRLPEHVKTSIIEGHNSSERCRTSGSYKGKDKSARNVDLAEASGEDTISKV